MAAVDSHANDNPLPHGPLRFQSRPITPLESSERGGRNAKLLATSRMEGLDMDYRKGEDFVSQESKETYAELLQIEGYAIKATVVPQDRIRDVVGDCRTP